MNDVFRYLLYKRKINAKRLAYGHQTFEKNYNYKYKNFRDKLTVQYNVHEALVNLAPYCTVTPSKRLVPCTYTKTLQQEGPGMVYI